MIKLTNFPTLARYAIINARLMKVKSGLDPLQILETDFEREGFYDESGVFEAAFPRVEAELVKDWATDADLERLSRSEPGELPISMDAEWLLGIFATIFAEHWNGTK